MGVMDKKEEFLKQTAAMAKFLKARGYNFEASLDCMTTAISISLQVVYGREEALKLARKISKAEQR